MYPLPLSGTETTIILLVIEKIKDAPPPPLGDGKKGFPGHWSGKSFLHI